ncbi:SPOR domain-containing protein [Sphingomonas donggukensis]|uniref:SPOR domain-containing protein n=1 Tax=Sphingomonas donggukensis TaxID=2949093 RepID=A0ABY4TV19_9SPHN|nr:SPOR domain-containing protein [Sphingomonas donggukensis]URW76250.1 SPOR domain-containing protein [Sphingomonas donggukensis]
MTTRSILAAALLTGASLAGGLAVNAASDTGTARRAASEAQAAQKALGKHKAAKAVAAAENAVAYSPRTASYRTLLGQAYLAAGRFPSAVGALNDALSLDPSDGVAALHLALAQIGTGDWAGARETLTTHQSTIPASDRGLAYALAGDPATAVGILTDAARAPGADAKTRQNLALALGLSGRWQEAKTVAAFDVAPADLDKRILQWLAFARPTSASDQVASLLGVTPVMDGGQPERLALRSSSPTQVAVAQTVAPIDTFMPGTAPGSAPAATPVAAAPAPAVQQTAEVTFTGAVPAAPTAAALVAFAPRAEVVQAVPVAAPRLAAAAAPSLIRAAAKPFKLAVPVRTAPAVTPKPAAKGDWVVQLGAFENAAVAQDSWARMTRRHRVLSGYTPNGVNFSANGASFYRLSVGGFARGDADAMCRKVRAGGGRCFVRTGAGDQVAAWKRAGVQLASR